MVIKIIEVFIILFFVFVYLVFGGKNMGNPQVVSFSKYETREIKCPCCQKELELDIEIRPSGYLSFTSVINGVKEKLEIQEDKSDEY